MSRPTKGTPGGRAYLDLQNRARRERRPTQELQTLYVLERWLARLAVSPHAGEFVLKGGMLLAVFDARRPTADADLLARNLANDQETVIARVVDVAAVELDPDDGVEFQVGTATAQSIRDDDLYTGVRISMICRISSASVKLKLDINFGDPVTPGLGFSSCRRSGRGSRRFPCSATRSRRFWRRRPALPSRFEKRTRGSVTTWTSTR